MRVNLISGGLLAAAVACGIALPGGPARAGTPDAAVRAAFAAVTANQPEKIFDMLPASYQRDIEQVVVAFANQADPELWGQTRALLGKLSGVLEKQGDLLATYFGKQMPAAEGADRDLRDGLRQLAAASAHLAGSSLTDLERLKEGRLRELLAGEGRRLMAALETIARTTPDAGNMWAAARAAEVDLVSVEDNLATVRVVLDGETEEVILALVEGRWIPEEMAADWREQIDDMNRAIKDMDPAGPEGQAKKVQSAMILNMIDASLTQIEKINTAEELDAIMGQLMMMIMMGGAMGR